VPEIGLHISLSLAILTTIKAPGTTDREAQDQYLRGFKFCYAYLAVTIFAVAWPWLHLSRTKYMPGP
jgi:hypothetical protein